MWGWGFWWFDWRLNRPTLIVKRSDDFQMKEEKKQCEEGREAEAGRFAVEKEGDATLFLTLIPSMKHRTHTASLRPSTWD